MPDLTELLTFYPYIMLFGVVLMVIFGIDKLNIFVRTSKINDIIEKKCMSKDELESFLLTARISSFCCAASRCQRTNTYYNCKISRAYHRNPSAIKPTKIKFLRSSGQCKCRRII